MKPRNSSYIANSHRPTLVTSRRCRTVCNDHKWRVTFDGEPESAVLTLAVGAEGDHHGVCAAGDVETERQVPAAGQRQLGAVVDDEDVGAAAGRRLERRVGGSADQHALVALRHHATDALGVGWVAVRVARAGEERRAVSDPPCRRADVRRRASYIHSGVHITELNCIADPVQFSSLQIRRDETR